MRRYLLVVGLAVAGVAASIVATFAPGGSHAARPKPATGIHKIKHVIVIMQENRSFDEYFGTYPGADGIPGSVCVPDPEHGGCVRPYHDTSDRSRGGPHDEGSAVADINNGAMDGFVAQAESGHARCVSATDPTCSYR